MLSGGCLKCKRHLASGTHTKRRVGCFRGYVQLSDIHMYASIWFIGYNNGYNSGSFDNDSCNNVRNHNAHWDVSVHCCVVTRAERLDLLLTSQGGCSRWA